VSGIRSVVTEDWQRDALRVVMVDHHARLVSIIGSAGAGTFVPILRMTPYDPEAMTGPDAEEVGILLPLAVARELYDALGRHFGVVPEPASRELVDVLKDMHGREADRVDHLIGVMTHPNDGRRTR
jgi:hypothetical protein